MKAKHILTATGLIFSILIIGVTGSLYFIKTRQIIKEDIYNHLMSVESIIHGKIDREIEVSKDETMLIATKTQLRISLKKYLETQDPEHFKKMDRILTDTVSQNASMDSLFITDIDGQCIISKGDPINYNKRYNLKSFNNGKHSVSFNKLTKEPDGHLIMDLTCPLHLNNQLIGVLFVEYRADKMIHSIQDYSGLGKTGEIILASKNENNQFMYLTPTRFNPNAAFKFLEPINTAELPFKNATINPEKEFMMDNVRDYRGKDILSVSHFIPQIYGVLQVKIDRNEAYNPLSNLNRLFIILALMFIVSSVFLAQFISSKLIHPMEILEKAMIEAKNNIDEKVAFPPKTGIYEINSLINSFKNLIKNLRSSNILLNDKIKLLKEEKRKLSKADQKLIRLGKIFEDSLNEIYLFDSKTLKCVQFNNKAYLNLRYTKEELLNITALDIKPEFNKKEFYKMTEPLVSGKQDMIHIETIHKRKDGSTYPVLSSLQLIKQQESEVYVAIVQDVTELEQSRKEMLKLNTAIEQSPVSVVITDKNGCIEFVNPRFTEITKYTFDEVKGKNPSVLKSNHHNNEFYKDLWDTILSGHTWQGEFLNKKKSGTLFWEEAIIGPVTDKHGNITHFSAVKQDITEKKELEKKLIESQKMEAIATLAGGIAHDFNNILGIISMNIQMALEFELEKDHTAVESLENVSRACDRAKELVKQILTISRKRSGEKKPTKLTPVLKEVLKFLHESMPSTIQVKSEISAEKDIILIDPVQIHQILMNLTTNAFHAISEKGLITVSLTNKTYSTSDEPQYIVLSVKDTGAGMTDEVKSKIFEPYFTTKQKGKGTGLGLAVVHSIVKNNQGSIKVISEPGKGTEFLVTFPLYSGYELPQEIQMSQTETILGNESILIIDDETPLIKPLKMILEKTGYTVTYVPESPKAIDFVKKKNCSFDLIITDFTMPEISGMDIAREVFKHHPEIPVIMWTGNLDSESFDTEAENMIKRILMKPVKSKDLLKIIREVLDNSESNRHGKK